MDVAIDLDETLINNGMKGDKYTIKKGVIRNLPKIRDLGYEFHLITARDKEQIYRVNYIVEHIEYMTETHFKTITCTSHQEKSPAAYDQACKYIIDD